MDPQTKITAVGVAALVWVLCATYLHRRSIPNLLLEPWTYVSLLYLQYFGYRRVESSVSLDVDLAICATYIGSGVAYYTFRRVPQAWFLYRIIDNLEPNSQSAASGRWTTARAAATLSIAIAVLVLIHISIAASAIGSLDAALVRFYAGGQLELDNPWAQRVYTNAPHIVLILLLLLRCVAIERRGPVSIMFWIGMAMYAVAMIPVGTVGFLVQALIVMVVVDCVYHVSGLRKANYATLIFSAVIVYALGAMLLAVRGQYFTGVEDLFAHLLSGMATADDANRATDISRQIVLEYTDIVFEKYGNDWPHIWPHTPFSIATNLVPRELWPEKPIGFGRLLALEMGSPPDSLTSFAAGIAGEGYANGGWLGVAGFAVGGGIISAVFANASSHLFSRSSAIKMVLGFMCWAGAFAYVRGDMLSAWAATVHPIALVLVLALGYKKLKLR